MIHVPRVAEFRVRQEGDRVYLVINDQCVADLQWDAAQALWQALRVKTLEAEEYAKANQVALDSAILLRAGARMVLSSNSKIVDEAKTLAAHDSRLRACMPHIKSQEAFGAPTLISLPPKG
jgi:hypothetical protein